MNIKMDIKRNGPLDLTADDILNVDYIKVGFGSRSSCMSCRHRWYYTNHGQFHHDAEDSVDGFYVCWNKECGHWLETRDKEERLETKSW